MKKRRMPATMAVMMLAMRMEVMFEECCKIIRSANTFLLTTHINPDGDAVGSVFALDEMLRSLGKETYVCVHEPVPRKYSFLNRQWQTLADANAISSLCDAVIVLDSPTPERIGDVQQLVRESRCIVNIDHHVSNANFGTCNVVDAEASSCGELVYRLAMSLRCTLSQTIAQYLYVAISTDTGSFRFSNTSFQTHEIIAALYRTGFDASALNERIYTGVRMERVALHGRLMSKISFASDGKIGWAFLSGEDLVCTGADAEDADGIVNVVLSIEGVRIAFFARALDDGEGIKVSLRSKGSYDVNKIARHFGGGGHPKAAGCKVPGAVDDAIAALVAVIKSEVTP